MDIDETQLAIWRLFLERTRYQRTLEEAGPDTHSETMREAEEALAVLPEISPLDALRANADLISRLSAQRWIAMKLAREEGANMEEIGSELRVSRQAAWEFLKRKIEEHGDDVPATAEPVENDAGRWEALQQKIEASETMVDADAWSLFAASHAEGDPVNGVVTRTVPFGAFVEIGGAIPGFLPRSEAPELPETGTEVMAVIDQMDQQKRRVSLRIE